MYGKVFDSIYDGTLYGNWEAIATLQQFIVLANADGVVDMTPQAIAARTSFPLDLLQRGIAFLSKPDPYSRTPGDEGRRIVLIDDHRPWGWRLVNHGKYQRLRDMAQKREADRVRMEEKRKKNKDVAIESQESQKVAHADAYADANANVVKHSAAAQDLTPILEKLPLRKGGEFEVRQSLVAELEPLYPNVDIPATLKEMRGWLLLNEGRRKTRQGVKAFIGRWLQTEQEKHGG